MMNQISHDSSSQNYAQTMNRLHSEPSQPIQHISGSNHDSNSTQIAFNSKNRLLKDIPSNLNNYLQQHQSLQNPPQQKQALHHQSTNGVNHGTVKQSHSGGQQFASNASLLNSSLHSNQQNQTQIQIQSRARINQSQLGGQSDTYYFESSAQPLSRFFQPAYDLFFEIARKLDKEMLERLKKQVPVGEKKESIMKHEASSIMSFVKIIFENMMAVNTELKVSLNELQNTHKIASLSTTHNNTTNQSNGNAVYDENSVEIACRYCKEYEQQLQKLEAEIRQHIRVQQQLKIHVDNTQSKIEEVERDGSKTEEKLSALSQEYEEVRRILAHRDKDMEHLRQQKTQLEKQLEQMAEKNKQLELKIKSNQSSASNTMTQITSLHPQPSFMKGKSGISNKHLINSFVDDTIPTNTMLMKGFSELEKNSSSKNNFSSLNTIQQLHRSQEIFRNNDSQKSINTGNNQAVKKLNGTMRNEEHSLKKSFSNQSDMDNSQQYRSGSSNNNGEKDGLKRYGEEEERGNENNKSQELYSIQKKLKKLQKISEKKLQPSDLNILKQLTERGVSLDKSSKPLTSDIQRNNLSGLMGFQKETLNSTNGNCITSSHVTDNSNTLLTENQNFNSTNPILSNLSNQNHLPFQNNSSVYYGNSGGIGSSSSMHIQMNSPPPQLPLKGHFNTLKSQTLSYSQIQQTEHNAQQILPNTSLIRTNNRPNSTISTRDSFGGVKNNSSYSHLSQGGPKQTYQKIGDILPSHTQSVSHPTVEKSSKSKIPKNLNQKPLTSVKNNKAASLIPQQKSSSSFTSLKVSDGHNVSKNTINNNSSSGASINVNTYLNTGNGQTLSPSKLLLGRQSNSDADRHSIPCQTSSSSKPNSINLNNKKYYEKLRVFMNCPKQQTEEELQANTRSQSMDGSQSYRNTCQSNSQRSQPPAMLNNNYTKGSQKQTNQSISSFQGKASNNSASHLGNSINNRCHI